VQSGQQIIQMKDTWNRSAGTYFGYIFIFRSISECSSCDATKMVEVSPLILVLHSYKYNSGLKTRVLDRK